MKALLPLLFVAAACADSIKPDVPSTGLDAATGTTDAPAATGRFQTTRGGDGTSTTIVDATNMTDWVHADFTLAAEVAMTEAWDLRFQRFHISTGTTGNQVAPIIGTTFAAVTTAPTTGWIADDAAAVAFDQGDGWYDYDGTTHVLSPKPIVWAVKLHTGAVVKMEITKYYDSVGTAAVLTLHWAPL
jgi:hypothetical protein